MSRSDKSIVLVLVIIFSIGFGGCTQVNQFGKTNIVEVHQTKKTVKFSEKYPNGRSLQDAIKDKVNGVTYE